MSRKKCQHGKEARRCKACGGKYFCIHGLRKDLCLECGGSRLCAHSKRKAYCVDCHGNQICSHHIRRQLCKFCGGSQLCACGNRKEHCPDCNINGAFRRIKKNANARGISFDITIFDYFWLTIGSCEYCGDFSKVHGLDRVDNNKGYEVDNLVPCCWSCNYLKGAKDVESFIQGCLAVASHQSKRGFVPGEGLAATREH